MGTLLSWNFIVDAVVGFDIKPDEETSSISHCLHAKKRNYSQRFIDYTRGERFARTRSFLELRVSKLGTEQHMQTRIR